MEVVGVPEGGGGGGEQCNENNKIEQQKQYKNWGKWEEGRRIIDKGKTQKWDNRGNEV